MPPIDRPKPKLPPAPKAAASGFLKGVAQVAPPPPSPSSAVATVAHAAGRGAQAVARTTHSAASTAGKAVGSTAARGAKVGTKAGQSAARQTYNRALINVFTHQSNAQQQAIIKGVQANPDVYESKVISAYLRSAEKVPAWHARGYVNTAAAKYDTSGGPLQNIEGGLQDIGKTLGGLIGKVPTYDTSSQRLAAEAAGVAPPGEIVKNAGKDLVNLPAEVGPSVAIPVSEALHGHWGQALNTFVAPYKHALEHPLQSLTEHPLNTALMFGGIAHPASALAESGIRKALGKPLNRVPESVHLTGNLTHERPLKSKSPIMRKAGPFPMVGAALGQDVIEHRLYKRNEKGKLVPRTENQRARLIKIETSRLVGENERVRTVGHHEEAAAHADAFIRGRANPARVSSTAGARRVERTVHSAKTALSFDPKAPLVKGSEVAGLAVRRVLRRPDTAVVDFEKYLKMVESSRSALLDRPKLLKIHDQTVAKLRAAEKVVKDMSRGDWERLFALTGRYRREYAPLERQAHGLGHFKDMTSEALKRRALMDATLLHMPGARFDEEHGMVRDLANGDTHPLSTDRMERFVREQTGGHLPAYVPNRTLEGDRAHFVSGQSRPYPAREGNTGFALTHGLVEPSHEALLEARVRLRSVIDSHRANNRLDQQLVITRSGNKPWESFNEALDDAPDGYRPIRLAKQFHPQGSLDDAIKGVDFASLIEEADHRSLDINRRLMEPDDPNAKGGAWGLIDNHAANQLLQHEKLIGPSNFLRGFRGANAQFRQVALALSFRHLPGVAQEELIRAAASGSGVVSWFAGRAAIRGAKRIDAQLGREKEIHLTGGTVTGQALSLRTRQVSRHFEGTLLHGPLSTWEKAMRAPGLRQAGYLWHGWRKFTLEGTKRFLEEQAQVAGIGRAVIDEFGGGHGLVAVALGQWGKMIDQAAKGVLDESTARRFRVTINRIYGRWTDLTPGEQTALMFSPFGMWWTNSVAWLSRLPVDHPVLSGNLAAANTGTEKQRKQEGLDMFAPGAMPLYDQGAIPLGGKLLQANYYSPFGVANDPLQTLESLAEPWLVSDLILPAAGVNWHGGKIAGPGGKFDADSTGGQRLTVIINSLAASFIPLYQKAQTLVQGGSSSYDTSTLLSPQTKGKNAGPLAGLVKDVMPVKLAHPPKSSGNGAVSVHGSDLSGVDIGQSLGGVDLSQSLK